MPLSEVQDGVQIKEVRDPALRPYTDMMFRGFDLDYPDGERAHEFLREWKDSKRRVQRRSFQLCEWATTTHQACRLKK